MLGFALISLFLIAGVVALVSLADSALRMRNAWGLAKRDAAQFRNVNAPVTTAAVVVPLRVAEPRPVPAMPLAAAA